MSTSGSIPAAPAGWYPDPAGTGRLRWWDGYAWTDQFSTPYQQGAYAGQYTASPYAAGPYANAPAAVQRPFISRDAPVYNALIWAITLLPLISTLLLLLWTPELRFITFGRQQTPTLDPMSIFTPGYFMLVFSGFVAYAASVLLAYFDSEGLKRIGVVRPFHWAWSFLSSAVYVIGRSVITSKVARGRGLVPIWVLIGVVVLNIVVTNIKMTALMSSLMGTIPA
ncbi:MULTISPECIES: DUF2510 domain-containing protein [unclassified Arthrobacter]|uniref:DUF2510 domain-containing protein n=1 Tax=unclassified Arthrobacter TaxID=235627 RepID=UPI0033975AEA